MDGESNGAQGQLVGSWWSPATTDVMSQLCRVCGEPAAGFHFGAFTCEGCKSFFGRTYNNLGSITECKNQGTCVINKKNRTSCKACRLRKCLLVGMSKSGSRYGRRSNWFKIHCLLQEQQHQQQQHQQQHQQLVLPPPASPPEKSPKGSHAPHATHAPHASAGVHGTHRGVGLGGLGLGAEGLYSPMLWAGPRALLPPPPPHGPHMALPFPPFLPTAAAAAAAAMNGNAASPLFMPGPAGPAVPHQRHEWSRLASPLSSARSSGSTSPPMSPRLRGPAQPPPRPAAIRHGEARRRLSSPRIEVDVDPDTEQEQPMDLSRAATACDRRSTTTPPSGAPDRDEDRDDCVGEDRDGSDSGVSERESDRLVDADRRDMRTHTPTATVAVDLSARLF